MSASYHTIRPQDSTSTESESLRCGIARRLLVEQAAAEAESFDNERLYSTFPDSSSYPEEGTDYVELAYSRQLQAAGWGGHGYWPGRLDLLRQYGGRCMCRQLTIEAGLELRSHYWRNPKLDTSVPSYSEPLPLSAYVATELRPRRVPLTVLIGEGACREEILGLLERVRDWLVSDYEKIVSTAPDAMKPGPTEDAMQSNAAHLTVGPRSWRAAPNLHWWSGDPYLSVSEARRLAGWLKKEAQRPEILVIDEGLEDDVDD